MTPLGKRRVVAAVIATCLTYVVANLILDTRQGEGRVLVVLTSTHGVHSGDVPVVLAWLVGMIGCAWIALQD
ncbi:hypothetical protein BH09ACT12_BH09ACT12_33230 [soil metagenome]